MTAEPNTSELEQAYNTVLDSHHRHWPQIPVARGLQPDYDAVVNALDMLAKAAGYDILASARIIGTFVKDGSRFDSAMGYRIGPAEPNTGMTTARALAVLRDLEALFAARTQSEYERSVFVEADQALSVLTQEIERLTDGLEAVAAQQSKTLDWLRANGIVFDGPLGTDPDNWEHVAFSIYTDLCEVDALARSVLAEHKDIP